MVTGASGVPSASRRRVHRSAGCSAYRSQAASAGRVSRRRLRAGGSGLPGARHRVWNVKTHLPRSVWLWIVLVVARRAPRVSSSFRGNGGYEEVDTSTALAQFDDGNVETATINDKEQTLDLELKTPVDGSDKVTAVVPAGRRRRRSSASSSSTRRGQRRRRLRHQRHPGRACSVSLLVSFLPFLDPRCCSCSLMNQMQGGGAPGHAVRQVQGQADHQGHAEDDVRRRRRLPTRRSRSSARSRSSCRSPAKFQAVGAKIPKGVLLYGPPGTGKTLLARAVAGEAACRSTRSPAPTSSRCSSVSAPPGSATCSSRPRRTPRRSSSSTRSTPSAATAAPAWAAATTSASRPSTSCSSRWTASTSRGGVILIAATNRPDILDPALLRPGRFDRQIAVDAPDLDGRHQILAGARARASRWRPDVDLLSRRPPHARLHRRRPGQRAQRGRAAHRPQQQQADRQRRPRRGDRPRHRRPAARTRLMSEKEKQITAYHEGGHALVAAALPQHRPGAQGDDPAARPGARATRWCCPTRTSTPRPAREMLDKLAYMLGGRAAEEMVFHDPTTGAGNDIEKATALARAMVTAVRHDRAARRDQARRQRAPSRSWAATWATSATTPRRSPPIVDEEIKTLLATAHQEACDILDENRDVLDALVLELLEKETLDKARGRRGLRAAAPPADAPGVDRLARARRRPTIPPVDDPAGDPRPGRQRRRAGRPRRAVDPHAARRGRRRRTATPASRPDAAHGRLSPRWPTRSGIGRRCAGRRSPAFDHARAEAGRPRAARSRSARTPTARGCATPRPGSPGRTPSCSPGLRQTPEDVLTTTFDLGHDEMVLVRDIELWSMCEHHLVPFTGVAHVGYIPAEDGRITGLSKLARLVDVYAQRPQVQERLTTQVADALIEHPRARGVIVVIEAEHLCMTMRGVRKAGAAHDHLRGARHAARPPPPAPRRWPDPLGGQLMTGRRPAARRPAGRRAGDGRRQRHARLVLRRRPLRSTPTPRSRTGCELRADGRRHPRRRRRVDPARRRPRRRRGGAAPGRPGDPRRSPPTASRSSASTRCAPRSPRPPLDGRRRDRQRRLAAGWPTRGCSSVVADAGVAVRRDALARAQPTEMHAARAVRRRASPRCATSWPRGSRPSLAAGVAAGADRARPGLGFAKTAEHNWELLARPRPARRRWATRCWSAPPASVPRPPAGRRRRRRRARSSGATAATPAIDACWPRRPAPGACACTTRGASVDAVRTRRGRPERRPWLGPPPHRTDRITLRGVRAHATTGSTPSSASTARRSSSTPSLGLDTRAAAAGDDLDQDRELRRAGPALTPS